jgi:molybdopterin-guanine dinucleotide biosynthesis protein B
MMRIFGFAGWSGSGKTTLMTALIPEFVSRGITVSTVKHAHHDFDIDRAGKDSWRHREAGAHQVMVASDRRWALMHELRGAAEPSLDALLQHLNPVDLVLVEGFKRHAHPKIEVYRRIVGKPLLHPEDPDVIAIAADDQSPEFSVPFLPLSDAAAIAVFVLRYDEADRWRS